MRWQLAFIGLFISISATTQEHLPAFSYSHGAIVRGDSAKKEVALVFTADEFGEGLPAIITTLKKEKIKAAFFFTGRFYRDKRFRQNIRQLGADGHYLGPHSDQHLLYCDWKNRDSLLITKDSFSTDIKQNIAAIKSIQKPTSPFYFIPPFEWWNDSIAAWSKERKLVLFNFTPGIRTAADYTWPELGAAYKTSEWIMDHVKNIVETKPGAVNGAIILVHAGTDPRRTDKFYDRLEELICYLEQKGYQFKRIDKLLASAK